MNPEVNKTILRNGIRILTQKIPHVRSVSMGVWVNVGARDETAPENGLSHFIEHMIFKGTRRRTGYQIAKEFDAIGGHTNAFTAMEHTCYHAKVLDTHLDTMVDILSDIFLNSVFEGSEVEKERPVILQEIGMLEDTPDDYIHLLAGNAFWGDNPLGRSILGPPENIRRFDADIIKAFFSRLYQPDRIIISMAGNLEHGRIVELVAPAFESIRPGNGFPERITPESRSLVTVTHKELEQAHICVNTNGLAAADPRRFSFFLMNTILGGNMSSRLFQEIRERRGLAYNVYAFTSSHADTGIFGVYAGVAPDKVQETTTLIIKEMQRLTTEPVPLSELQASKEFTKGNLLLASESSDSQMVRMAQNELYFGRNLPLEEVIEGVDRVCAEDILELAATLFRPGPPAVTILGPVEDPDSILTQEHDGSTHN
ncbi:MAG: pitrilysin family protein [Thermodesulfobacteriota bacterium]